ncbi:Crinkler effector [Abortiporus biennis]
MDIRLDPFRLKKLPLSKKLRNRRDENQDVNNWEWLGRTDWKKASSEWQIFNSRWRSASTEWPDDVVDGRLIFSRPKANLDEVLIVRDEYPTLFEQIFFWGFRRSRSGVVITGQPGVGKTLFQYYCLARLLREKQIVLISLDGISIYLFYFDEVYIAHLVDVENLNYPRARKHEFIWLLVDTETQGIEPSPRLLDAKFPVQSSSLNPDAYQSWTQKRDVRFFCMDIWTREELEIGLRYHHEYDELIRALRAAYDTTAQISVNDSKTSQEFLRFIESPENIIMAYPEIGNFLYRLQAERINKGNVSEEMSSKKVISALLDNATYRFGYVPRDVFQGVFYPETLFHVVETALGSQTSWEGLQKAVSSLLAGEVVPEVYHSLIVQKPCRLVMNPDPQFFLFRPAKWTFQFKSQWVAEELLRKIGSVGQDRADTHWWHTFVAG